MAYRFRPQPAPAPSVSAPPFPALGSSPHRRARGPQKEGSGINKLTLKLSNIRALQSNIIIPGLAPGYPCEIHQRFVPPCQFYDEVPEPRPICQLYPLRIYTNNPRPYLISNHPSINPHIEQDTNHARHDRVTEPSEADTLYHKHASRYKILSHHWASIP